MPRRLSLFAALLTASVATAAGAAETSIGPTSVKRSPLSGMNVTVGGTQLNNDTTVGGDASTATKYRSLGANLRYDNPQIMARFEAERLRRDIAEKSLANDIDKDTVSLRPEVGYKTASYTQLTAGYEVIQTSVANPMVGLEDYKLNTGRAVLGIARDDGQNRLNFTFSSEARAEKEYALQMMPGMPPMTLVDRDYIPAQADLNYARKMNEQVTLSGGIRYSQYNNDVYKDQYDSDVPSTPTFAQVFDYLLSFKAGATYAFNRTFAVSSELGRKAALDTNSFTGDEYLVGTTGKIATWAQLDQRSTVGLGFVTSSGKKTHEVQGTSYDYANRQQGYEATLTVSM